MSAASGRATRTPPAGAVVVAGAVARRPGRGGHAWALLQYALGFRRLGWDVLFLDSVDGGPGGPDTAAVAWMDRLAARFGLEGDVALLVDGTGPRATSTIGPGRGALLERVAAADLFLNVMGYVRDEEILAAARRRVFIDIDPGFGQMWQDLGLARPFDGHDAFVTVGPRIGRPDCTIPTLGLGWIPSLPPVVLERFPASPPTGRAFTSICTWRGPFDPIEHGGRTYGLRAHECRRFLDLPARTGARFELALDIDAADAHDRARLEAAGWVLRDPAEAAGDPDSYAAFIRGSAAEIGIAKGLYVDTRCGWFSDRSACYLASGRPVVAQDTGWSERLPSGAGLFAFSTPGEAAAAVAAVRSDPARQGRAAREIAEAHFDSDRVLTALAERAGAASLAGAAP